ncbi:MAG: lysophospholipid acyltransferase family protein, partial [Candidatus Omnitrophica bacterium]|nr:lysophospholipid acyltransferase family protein [Candidatus Omnitrophota bacterium]
MTDYLAYITLRFIGPFIRILPLRLIFFLGKGLGSILYSLDLKHRAIAYSNIKQALGNDMPPREIKRLTRKFYRCFGQDIAEIFIIPLMDKQYFNKYIEIEGKEYIDQAFSKGKGVIFVGIHAGSWELSNVICSSIGFPFNVLVRGQEKRLLNSLLNEYRKRKGCKIIERKNEIRQLIEALKNNEGIGITVDQGGKTGMPVEFFGKDASMPTGAIKLALNYDALILPAFYTRLDGPYQRVMIQPPFEMTRTKDKEKDLRGNLQRLTALFEGLIKKYPYEYLWTYKIWKYSLKREVVV